MFLTASYKVRTYIFGYEKILLYTHPIQKQDPLIASIEINFVL